MVAQASAQTIFDLLDSKASVTESTDASVDGQLMPSVTFETVKFTYPGGRQTTHSGLDFQIGVGERFCGVKRGGEILDCSPIIAFL